MLNLYREDNRLAIARRPLKGMIVAIASLTRVLVSCVVGVWLDCISVVHTTVRESATSDTKENKQADAGTRLFSKVFSAARCCESVRQQSVKVYLHICATGKFSNTLKAQHPLSRRIFPSLPGSRLRFFIAVQIQHSTKNSF